eukprot:GDKH01028417.1.p1 GENE.GDKH01028417.1~~GDKH01028417.1.p1  ORF type:complete len:100 (+),score=7.31 GDKH01028417.1:159-458(+)
MGGKKRIPLVQRIHQHAFKKKTGLELPMDCAGPKYPPSTPFAKSLAGTMKEAYFQGYARKDMNRFIPQPGYGKSIMKPPTFQGIPSKYDHIGPLTRPKR